MNRHLTPEEFVDAAEHALTASRRAHLDGCATCAAQVAELAALTREVAGAAPVHEPSPLFWDHLSRRIHEAANTAAVDRPRAIWRWTAMVTAAAALAIAAFVAWPAAPETPDLSARIEPAASDEWLPVLEDGPWTLVLDMAVDLDWDEAKQVAAPRAGTTDAVIAELTPAEREQLVRLLKREIGELE